MKKLAIAFIICLIPFLCNAGMNPYVAGAIPTAASSCSVDNDEIGTRVDTTNADTSKDVAKCFLEVADCSGTLAKGFIADYYTTTWTAKICIYSYDNDAPDDGDGRLSCSGVITGDATSGVTWVSADMDTAESVTQGTSYWKCIFVNVDSADVLNGRTNSGKTGTLYYMGASGFYADPPEDLSGTWNTTESDPVTSAYVTIQ